MSTSYQYKIKQQYVEFGSGYFKPIKKQGIFEIYAGIGLGKTLTNRTTSINDSSLNMSADFTRFFLQPSYTFFSNDIIEVAFSMRYSALKFHNVSNPVPIYDKDYSYMYGINEPLYHFIEPVATCRIGHKRIKGYIQGGFSYLLNNSGHDVFVTGSSSSVTYSRTVKSGLLLNNPFILGFGISINIAERYKKKI